MLFSFVIRILSREGKRAELVEKYGYDIKFAYHIVRLMDEIEQILSDKTLVLGRNKEELKSIRRGEWSKEQIVQFFNFKEKQLEDLYHKSDLRKYPDEDKIKSVLMQCLEIAYDDVRNIVQVQDQASQAVQEILEIMKSRHFI